MSAKLLPVSPPPNQVEIERLRTDQLRIRRDTALVIWGRAFDLGGKLVSGVTVGFLGFCAWKSVESLSGKDTFAFIHVLTELEIHVLAPWALVGILTLALALQVRLNARLKKEHGSYAARLESKIDPGRSSSGLTLVGKPPKEVKNAS